MCCVVLQCVAVCVAVCNVISQDFRKYTDSLAWMHWRITVSWHMTHSFESRSIRTDKYTDKCTGSCHTLSLAQIHHTTTTNTPVHLYKCTGSCHNLTYKCTGSCHTLWLAQMHSLTNALTHQYVTTYHRHTDKCTGTNTLTHKCTNASLCHDTWLTPWSGSCHTISLPQIHQCICTNALAHVTTYTNALAQITTYTNALAHVTTYTNALHRVTAYTNALTHWLMSHHITGTNALTHQCVMTYDSLLGVAHVTPYHWHKCTNASVCHDIWLTPWSGSCHTIPLAQIQCICTNALAHVTNTLTYVTTYTKTLPHVTT